jgi:shikimate kinase
MKLNKNLVLVGMMGSGKSSIGKIVAKKLEFEFIDTDSKIEETEKKTISDIFKKDGEKYFRNIEEDISLKSLKLKNKVIALGGGGYINPSIRKYTLNKCISVWLDWENETLINRIQNSKKRPLAMKLNSLELQKLIIKRSSIYNLSDYKINCDKLDKKKIVEKIIKLYENS